MKKLLFAVLLSGVLLVPVIAFASTADQERAFRATFAGIYTNKDDFHYTGTEGEVAGFGIVTGKSTLGAFIAYVVTSGVLGEMECAGEGGTKGVVIFNTGEDFALTFNDTGEQLFLKLNSSDPGQACRVPGGGGGGSFNFDVIGGTGRFEGATGTISKRYQLILLAAPPNPGKGSFRSFTGTFAGNIKLAGENSWPF